jgi:hypothetical protein
MIQREFLAKAIGLEVEADRAGRAVIMARVALDNQQRRPAGMLYKAVLVEGPGEPEMRGMDRSANLRTHTASRTPSVREVWAPPRCAGSGPFGSRAEGLP